MTLSTASQAVATALVTLWWLIGALLWHALVVVSICALASGFFRWSRLERAYVGTLRFLFKRIELASIAQDNHHLSTTAKPFSGSREAVETQDEALDAIYDKYKCDSTENENKVNGKTKRRKTNVIGKSLDLIHLGLSAIVDDEVTPRFKHQRLKIWNMMTRTKRKTKTPWWTQIVWAVGLFTRYVCLLPLRLLSFFGLYLGFFFITVLASSLLPRDGTQRCNFYRRVIVFFFGQFSGCVFSPTFHDVHNRPKRGLAVSNHTSPYDVFLLLNDVAYTMTGQNHRGYIGILQWLFSQLAPQIWFERTSASDRNEMRRMLIEHAKIPENPPIIVFPEGTCINNTATMMFRKGSFECFDVVHPIAIKYDPMFCDFFWNSSVQSSMRYLVEVLTSWQVVCDIWYLPPMTRRANESASDFTYRVKRAISRTAQLDELPWDGNLKRSDLKKEFKERAQCLFSRRFS